jgi:homoserine O-acetyltransferase/O-succinyltransferase
MKVSSTLGVTPDLPSSARRTFMKAAAGAVGVLGGAAGRLNVAPIIPAAAQSSTPIDYQVFDLGSVQLQSGTIFPNAKLAYKTYGALASDKSNVIVMPSYYSGTHKDVEWLIAADKILDPSRYFVISVNMFGSGLSSSPSNSVPPIDRGRYPKVALTDNVRMQHRLVTEVFGVNKIALVFGFSMGAQQAYHWGALFPDMVERICVICGSARTSPNNFVFLEGAKAALTTDCLWQDNWFATPPVRGLKAFGRGYAGWWASPAFYNEGVYKKLGSPTIEDYLVGAEAYFLQHDANNLLAQLWSWQNADISANEMYGGDLVKALGSIKAKALIMPSETDRYFGVAENAAEVAYLPTAELRPIPTIWGHLAGNPNGNEPDTAFLAQGVRDLLAA